ncbi:hypothetical protein D9613_010731 [Agrocybe pediades]|uniref:Uncharacterized protein n=1 Tax=Agrocybe pediades TaxID=84607 RepID=A0A8H4VKI1_9AGAR|nr:hypothetical protein D9613_010731 [Agrocybe pediades]
MAARMRAPCHGFFYLPTRHYPHSNPISPLANMDLAYSRPVHDDEEIDDYPITGRKTHRLQHSTSMPLVTRGGSRSILVHSVPSSPPRSPAVTSSTSTTTTSPASAAVSPTSQLAEFDTANLVGKPILSPEEIAQLERDAEMGIPYSFPQYPPPPSMRIDTSSTPAAPSTSASAVPSSPSTTYGLIEGSSVIALSPPPLAHSRLTSPDRVAAAANLRKKLSGMSIAESVSSRRSGSGLSGATGSGSNDEVATGSSAPATTGRLTGAPRQRPKLSLAGLGSSAAATASSSSGVHSPTNVYQAHSQQHHSHSLNYSQHQQHHRTHQQQQAIRSPTTSTSASAHPSASASASASSSSSAAPTSASSPMASAKALLRRVRSGSSLRMDRHVEEFYYADPSMGSSPPLPLSPIASASVVPSPLPTPPPVTGPRQIGRRGREVGSEGGGGQSGSGVEGGSGSGSVGGSRRLRKGAGSSTDTWKRG